MALYFLFWNIQHAILDIAIANILYAVLILICLLKVGLWKCKKKISFIKNPFNDLAMSKIKFAFLGINFFRMNNEVLAIFVLLLW